MTVDLQRTVLISALRMTKGSSIRIEDISLDARVPVEIVSRILRKNSEREIVRLEGKTVAMTGEQRLKAAMQVVEMGADLERVCNLLGWDEFEDFSALAFQSTGFLVEKHFRFKHLERRWEVDILALKNPIVASVDCKHWHRGWRRSNITKIVEDHIKRTEALAEASPLLRERMGISRWKEAKLIPVILSLIPSDFKFYENVPIVPILQLRNFIEEMPTRTDQLMFFSKKFSETNFLSKQNRPLKL